MNIRVVVKLLGIVALLIGATMLFSLPWAHPSWGNRAHLPAENADLALAFEKDGFWALVLSIVVSTVVGGAMFWYGRKEKTHMFRKEAMAVVGLSWVMATLLGALPFTIAKCYRSSGIRITEDNTPQLYAFEGFHWNQWLVKEPLSEEQKLAVEALLSAGAVGRTEEDLRNTVASIAEAQALGDVAGDPISTLTELADSDSDWKAVLRFPDSEGNDHYRVRWVPVSFADALFESQSGFSTTGATILSDLENPELIPHCLLFWRSSTHFLGGLGIIVLFVVVLGQGSAGKAMMRAEMPGPTKEGTYNRMQHTAWSFAAMYCGLNLVLTLILKSLEMTWFDAICHAFGTMATGGFSTYNASLGNFQSPTIDYVVILFMILAGTNFTLLYYVLIAKPLMLFADVEWRTYMSIILIVTLLVLGFGLAYGDFRGSEEATLGQQSIDGLRFGLFQVVAVITTTGYGTHDFDQWNSFGRAALFALMFVGGCAGSTGGGMKVIRHVLFGKILMLELEQAFHPTVVRPLRLGGKLVDDSIRRSILVYFGFIIVLFVGSWLFLVTFESDRTWGADVHHKLIDSASAIAATLNNIGPGLGTVGATQNYGHFSALAKILFTMLMMIGRVEIFAILVLFSPRFWRAR